MSWFRFGFGKKDGKSDGKPKDGAVPDAAHERAPGAGTHEAPALPEQPPAEAVPPEPGSAPTPPPVSSTDAGAVPLLSGAPPPHASASEAHEPAPPDRPDIRAQPPAPESRGLFARLASGLKKSSSRLTDAFTTVFAKRRLDGAALEELEELLISADLGAAAAARVTARLARDKFDAEVTGADIRAALAAVVAETLQPCEQALDMSGPGPRVVLFVGVNGSGKTTTLGKIAVKMAREGASVITVAGDTFRAAAVEQLDVWSQRAGARFMSRPIGSDAAGLAYDAVATARRDGAHAVLIDTAGRLQNKTELMDELRKIVRVIRKMDETAPHHVLLVLDGTVGSNALSQAEAFIEAGGVTGLIMTKLDGTAKGGALVQVAERYRLPIHFIGVGEGEADLQAFSARAFARALSGLAE
ncbi:MAG: signal recognition particle-docking protein FtsY [Alphaproteobacteria bacterium]|nr:signal recognition particle-docking protein FtsY [Alphaproteobacteria bacterium]